MLDSLAAFATLEGLVRLAGIGQLLLVAASPAIPRTFGWREELARNVRPLTRKVFWTWAAYVWLTHLAFGLLSTFGARLLVDGTTLAGVVSAFMAAWWSARLVVQFTYFEKSAAPPGRFYALAEVALVLLFVGLAAVYGVVAFRNLAPST